MPDETTHNRASESTVLASDRGEHLVDPTTYADAAAFEQPWQDAEEAPHRPLGFGAVAALIVGGVASIYVALAVLTSVRAEARVVLTVIGLLLIYAAYRAIGQRLYGPRFQSGLWLAVGWLVLALLAAVFADFLPLSEARDPSLTLQEPVLASPDLASKHPLGTDRQGLDVLGGIIYGLRVSATVGLGAVVIGILIGGTIGTIAGYFRKAIDQVVELLTNSMLAFPPLILLMGIAAVLDRNVRNTTITLSVLSIPIYARLARATAMVISKRDFVLAAKALGARSRRIIVKDIVPGVMRPVMAYAFVIIAVIIVAEASLSFLGLGIPRPEPTLGNMISAGQSDFDTYPHLVFAPAIALLLTVLSLNQIGEVVQSRWSPSESKL